VKIIIPLYPKSDSPVPLYGPNLHVWHWHVQNMGPSTIRKHTFLAWLGLAPLH